MDSIAIYQVSPGRNYVGLDLTLLWEQAMCEEGVSGGYNGFCSYAHEEKVVVLAMQSNAKHIDAYQLDETTGQLVLVQHTSVALPYDNISAFTIGGMPHVVAYHMTSGTLDFYRVHDGLGLTLIYSYNRTYGTVTTGYTTLIAYDYQGMMLLLAYNQTTGDVATYQLQVTSSEPLILTLLWSTKWSVGWHNFALFQLGGENFFLKSNLTRGNETYIDHLVDNPANGSRPVGRHLPPLTPTALAALAFDGIQYFATYDAKGTLDIYRIRNECTSWAAAGVFDVIANGRFILPITGVKGSYLMVC